MGWIDTLKDRVVGLDTTPLIYFTEAHPSYKPIVAPFFAAMRQSEFKVITSIVTLIETLVYPMRTGDTASVQIYRDLLLNEPYITTKPLNQEIAEEAARLRAVYKLHTPDAIQLATAIVSKAPFFLTNDKKLAVVQELKVLVVDDLKLQELA